MKNLTFPWYYIGRIVADLIQIMYKSPIPYILTFSFFFQVRLRPRYAQWRYKLDVFVNSRPIYFDRYPQQVQHFPGVTVYTPTNILNQSHVVMMFKSGAGVEVLENKHYMAARVYLPWEFIVSLFSRKRAWKCIAHSAPLKIVVYAKIVHYL